MRHISFTPQQAQAAVSLLLEERTGYTPRLWFSLPHETVGGAIHMDFLATKPGQLNQQRVVVQITPRQVIIDLHGIETRKESIRALLSKMEIQEIAA